MSIQTILPQKQHLTVYEQQLSIVQNKGRTFLTIPWNKGGRARKLGAIWSPSQRIWFVPEDVDLQPFRKAGYM